MVQVKGWLEPSYSYSAQLVLHNGLYLRDAVRATQETKHIAINRATLSRRVFARRRAPNVPEPKPSRPTALNPSQERYDVSVRSGYLDTLYGCLLTTTAAKSATKLLEKRRTKKLTYLQKTVLKDLSKKQKAEEVRRLQVGPPFRVMSALEARLGAPVDQIPESCSIKLRRAVSRARTAARQMESVAGGI